MSEPTWYVRDARGGWFAVPTFEDAVRDVKLLAGDTRMTPTLYCLAVDAWLYVGPRPRRRATWCVAHVVTAAGAELVGFTPPATWPSFKERG